MPSAIVRQYAPYLDCAADTAPSSRAQNRSIIVASSILCPPVERPFTVIDPKTSPNVARNARLKVSPAFSKAAGSRGGAPGRPPQRAELSCAQKAQEGVQGGTLAGGSPFLRLPVCAVALAGDRGGAACSTPFLCARAKKRGGAPKKRAFGGGLCRIRGVRCVSQHVSGCPARRVGTFAPGEGEVGACLAVNAPATSCTRAQSAFESFARLFKGGRVQGQSPWSRSAERETPLCSKKRRRGSKGEPSPGVPPSYVFSCAPLCWAVDRGDAACSTPFLCSRAKKRGGAPKKRAFCPQSL